MAGKFCFGSTNSSSDTRLTKAYCEGRKAAADGALIGTNPHESGSEANTAWAAGFASHTADPDGHTGDCCADAYGAGYVPE